MSDEKPNNPPPAPINKDTTAGKPVAPLNKPQTREAKPMTPQNKIICLSQDGNTGKPTPPPNTESTKGGGK